MTEISTKKLLDQVERQILSCPTCLSAATGLLVPGEGSSNANIVFVGEAPGKNESATGRPFVGRAGKLLDSLLAEIGVDRQDIFITSAVKYLPKDYVTPKPADIEHGRTHLLAQLEVIKPAITVLMGAIAAKSLLLRQFFIAQEHGNFIRQGNLTYFLSYHPAAPLYNPKLRGVISQDFQKLKKYL